MSCSPSQVFIRPFEAKDYEAVTYIIYESFKHKFKSLIQGQDEVLLSLIKALRIIKSSPQQGYFVAEKDQEILGVMRLKWKNQYHPHEPWLRNAWHLSKIYGLWPLLKLKIGYILLEENVPEGVCYIEHIAVSPLHRGKGIGGMLLNHGKAWAVGHPFLRQYALYVAAHNKNAIKLYLTQGFDIIAILHSFTTKIFFHEEKWFFMSQSVK